MKESLEHNEFAELEPAHWFDQQGLFIWGKGKGPNSEEVMYKVRLAAEAHLIRHKELIKERANSSSACIG